MNLYTASSIPAGLADADVVAAANAALPSPPDGAFFNATHTAYTVAYASTVLTPQQVSAFQAAVAAATTNPNLAPHVLDTLVTRAQTALSTNATFLGLASPTQAQAIAQVQALTKQCNGIIRLLLGQLDSTAGT